VIKISTDLFNPQNAFDLYQKTITQNIQIDLLVNDAGQGQYGEFVDSDIQRQLDIIRLNVESVVILNHCFLKDMVAKESGKILNLPSVAAKIPGPLQAVYHGTKAFVHSFTEAIREEVKDHGVSVTSLLPGATQTDFF
jgi:short-subunit dehydrogenase